MGACLQPHAQVRSSWVPKERPARYNTTASPLTEIMQTPLLSLLNQNKRYGWKEEPSEVSGSFMKSKSLKLGLIIDFGGYLVKVEAC